MTKVDTTIALQQPIIPDYRMGLFLLLREQWVDQFQIYAGEADFGGTPISTPKAWGYFKKVRNLYLLGGRLLWQRDSFWKLVGSDVTILNANLRMVSNWMILLLRRLLGRPTILWGHAEGQSGVAGKLRNCFLRLSKGFIAYTHSQAELLGSRYPGLPVWTAANSCVFASDCMPVGADGGEPDSFLYVGRLVSKKKVHLLLEGFIVARNSGSIPADTRLVFVGDGGEVEALQRRVAEAEVQNVVSFAGHVSEVEKLREFYGRAICSVSPGYVGLSATQSFSFGIPMLIAKDEFHSPEIEACRDGFNARFFESDSADSLARALSDFRADRSEFQLKREEISSWTKSNYSFETMRDTFVSAVEEVMIER